MEFISGVLRQKIEQDSALNQKQDQQKSLEKVNKTPGLQNIKCTPKIKSVTKDFSLQTMLSNKT